MSVYDDQLREGLMYSRMPKFLAIRAKTGKPI